MKTAFALSGGGVLGAAHIGPLEQLERRGMRPDFVVGTSAGAIIGLLFAAGGTALANAFLDELAASFASPQAMLMGTPQKVFAHVEALLATYAPRDRRKLPVPFYPVATDLATGMRKAFTEGDAIAGVMASAAYPGVFPPQSIGGRRYVDGGLTANLPAAVARELGAGRVIGSSIYDLPALSRERTERLSVMRIAQRSLDILQAELAREQAGLCDFCFRPPIMGAYQWYHLRSIPEIREAGRRHAAEEAKGLPGRTARFPRLPFFRG